MRTVGPKEVEAFIRAGDAFQQALAKSVRTAEASHADYVAAMRTCAARLREFDAAAVAWLGEGIGENEEPAVFATRMAELHRSASALMSVQAKNGIRLATGLERVLFSGVKPS